MERGETTFKITVTCLAVFSDVQIAACVIGETTTVSVDGINLSGTVAAFGCRSGHSICQLDNAAVVMN